MGAYSFTTYRMHSGRRKVLSEVVHVYFDAGLGDRRPKSSGWVASKNMLAGREAVYLLEPWRCS
jgi:hypothetical protein